MKNTITKAIMVALLGLGTAGATLAADPVTAGRHGHAMSQEERAAKMEEHKAKFAEMVAKHQAALHDKLKLTAAQEPAWQTFVAAVTPTLPTLPDHAATSTMTTPERLDQHLAMAKQHLAKMETRVAATKVFYAQLTPEQQKTFDAEAARMHHHMAGRMGHRMMMMHHRGGM
jgi:periplasmic protein CpxP/Spy